MNSTPFSIKALLIAAVSVCLSLALLSPPSPVNAQAPGTTTTTPVPAAQPPSQPVVPAVPTEVVLVPAAALNTPVPVIPVTPPVEEYLIVDPNAFLRAGQNFNNLQRELNRLAVDGWRVRTAFGANGLILMAR